MTVRPASSPTQRHEALLALHVDTLSIRAGLDEDRPPVRRRRVLRHRVDRLLHGLVACRCRLRQRWRWPWAAVSPAARWSRVPAPAPIDAVSSRGREEFEQGRRDRFRALPRHEVAGAVDDAARDELRERRALVGILRGRSAETVAPAIQRDRRRLDTWTLRETLLGLEEPRFTWRVADAVAIRVNHHVDEVGVVERCGGPFVGLGRELPGRRPGLPQEPADRATILLEADAPALGVEVVPDTRARARAPVAPAPACRTRSESCSR